MFTISSIYCRRPMLPSCGLFCPWKHFSFTPYSFSFFAETIDFFKASLMCHCPDIAFIVTIKWSGGQWARKCLAVFWWLVWTAMWLLLPLLLAVRKMLILHLQVMTLKVINKSLHVKRLWLFGFFYNLFNAVCSTRKKSLFPRELCGP